MKSGELFIIKQQAVINMGEMERDSALSFFKATIVMEKSMVMDTQHDPIWLDDDSRSLNIMEI